MTRSRILMFKCANYKPVPFSPLRLHDAYDIGFCGGVADRHHEDRTFSTSAEYSAWLAGWRAGQIELAARRRQSESETERVEMEARERLGEAFRVVEGSEVAFMAVSSL